ncbi:MAG: phytoene desaturase family protein [Alphaproteobacteria bacterium]
MERYDVAVIGAGLEGLTAAAILARAGLRVIVLEKNTVPGGRTVSREFHPGFSASPYCDEVAPIPKRLFWSLNLARRDAVLLPAPASICISDTGVTVLYGDEERLLRTLSSFAAPGMAALRREARTLLGAVAAHAEAPAQAAPSRFRFWERPKSKLWPAEELGQRSLADELARHVEEKGLLVHAAADRLCGRAVSPFLAGTALHLLAGMGSGMAVGGLGALGAAFVRVAEEAGAAIRCNVEVSDVRIKRNAFGQRRAIGIAAAGEEIEARAVLSTLDAKRSFLSLCEWKSLPQAQVRQAAQYRVRGQCARVLLALDSIPDFEFAREAPDAARGPIHVAASLEAISQAHDSWRSGVLPEKPFVTLRVPSLSDPRLAPPGTAVMTATLSAIPARLFDGAWTPEKRARLVSAALAAADTAASGTSGHVLASEVLAAPEIEAGLGLSDGDLEGGEMAPDQAFSFRPWRGTEGGRTAVAGFYLAGASTPPAPFLTGASGQRAAQTILADIQARRL